MEVVAVDLDVGADGHVGRRDKAVVIVHVLVLAAAHERALDDARVLLRGLEDAQRVVAQIERDDELALDVLRHARVEPRRESQDLLVIVHILEEISLGLVRHQLVDVTERVDLVSEAVVRRNLPLLGLPRLRQLDLAELEVLAVGLLVELLRELVHSVNPKDPSEDIELLAGLDLIARNIVVTDKVLTWLIYSEAFGELLSPQEQRERVPPVVSMVDLSDLDRVVSQVVMDDKRQIVALREESEDFAIVVQELLLRNDSSASKRLFEELFHLSVSNPCDRLLFGREGVFWDGQGLGLRLADVLKFELKSKREWRKK